MLFSLPHSHAQQLIVGKIIGAEDTAVNCAVISLLNTADSTTLRSATSNEKGEFTLKNDTQVTFLQITSVGYDTLVIPVPNTRDGGPTGLGKIDMGTIVLQKAIEATRHCRLAHFWHNLFHRNMQDGEKDTLNK